MTQPPPPAPRPQPYAVASPVGGVRPATIGLVLAVVAAAIGVIRQILSVFIPFVAAQFQYSTLQISTIFGALTLVHTAVAIAALILGIVGAQRGGAPVRAGVAIGVGALGLLGGIVSLAAVPLVGLAL